MCKLFSTLVFRLRLSIDGEIALSAFRPNKFHNDAIWFCPKVAINITLHTWIFVPSLAGKVYNKYLFLKFKFEVIFFRYLKFRIEWFASNHCVWRVIILLIIGVWSSSSLSLHWKLHVDFHGGNNEYILIYFFKLGYDPEKYINDHEKDRDASNDMNK